jgi:hypothetical protein
MADAKFLAVQYPRGKADLYAAFLERGLQLVKPGGISALLTMRNWMFIQQFSAIRETLLEKFDLRILGDVDRGAFEDILDEVVSTTMSIFRNAEPSSENSVAIQPTPLDDNSRDSQRTNRKRAAVLAQVGRFEFRSDRFRAIKEQPIVYWWDEEFIDRYTEAPKLEKIAPVKSGMQTADNNRFLRKTWEIAQAEILLCSGNKHLVGKERLSWVPYIQGGKGKVWFEPPSAIIDWRTEGLPVKVLSEYRVGATIRNPEFFFSLGIAFTPIGASFTARAHRYRSICDTMGSSVFPSDLPAVVCLMNSNVVEDTLKSLNPSIHFQVGDVNRLPLFPIESATEIFAQLETAFTQHEAARETSVEFRHPGPTCWAYAQTWAQQAVDRPAGEPLPAWNPTYEEATAEDWVSYSIGIALGRFNPVDAETPPNRPPAPNSGGAEPMGNIQSPPELGDLGGLPHGILYLSTYRDTDSLIHPAAAAIHTAWATHGGNIAQSKTLHHWLRTNFFKDTHLKRYDQRPIYFPLSSTKLNFVAHISIHRWADDTLQILLADHLIPELTQLEGELADLLDTRHQANLKADRKAQNQADDRYNLLLQLRDELQTFIALIRQCADQGPPIASPKDPQPETTARYRMDLDDGVMINSAALWPLLEPQGWKKPKTWWSELCTAQGKKDYDWSHLAARYFPDRVDTKCQTDPSLAVAHGVFWKYHPAKAYEWELRLQDEIAPDFTIDEPGSDPSRQTFETDHPETVLELKEKEEKRRDRKRKKAASDREDPEDDYGPLFDDPPDEI